MTTIMTMKDDEGADDDCTTAPPNNSVMQNDGMPVTACTA